jgi:ADP-heptose:LPS heptosyltransferase
MKNLVIAFLKLQAKFIKRNRIVDVFGTFDDAQAMLILMPDILEDFGIARKFIRTLTESFSKAKLHFVMRSSFKSLLDSNLNYGTIFVADRDENYMGLPKKDLKQRILATKFDIAIDLNNDFHLLSTYLCQISGAKLRICFDNNDREPFYNFYFRSQTHKNLEDKYKRFIQYLCACVNPEKANN